MRLLKIALLLGVAAAVQAQDVTCTTAPPLPLIMRAEGLAEPVSDIVLNCTGGTPGPSMPIQITVELSANLTSRILDTASASSEALLLIDEPQPDAVNMSNGFPYNGQVLGKPGIGAGASGSGNVYLGRQASDTSITWSGIPLVAPGPSGTRTLRITNLRANATIEQMTGPWDVGDVNATISGSIPIGNPALRVGFTTFGLVFSSVYTSPSVATLTFGGTFPLLRTRTANQGGQFVPTRQDIPGGIYYGTESQFTPCLSYGNCATPPGSPIGLANSGTLLAARITGLGSEAAFLSVPNQVCFVLPGWNTCPSPPLYDLYLIVNGQPITGSGSTSLPVTNGIVDVLYEVTFSGIGFPYSVPVTLLDASGNPLDFPGPAVFAGRLAPLSTVGTASATAPEPRFVASAAGPSPSVICQNAASVVPTVRSEGLAEPVGDFLLACAGGTPGPSTPVEVTVTLNTNLTSRNYGTPAVGSEALLLIDDPAPGQINMSNGFQYNGQVLGKPGVAAGAAGSGNVYIGRQSSASSVTWSGIPFVAPGTSGGRFLRFVNLRANAAMLPPGPNPISASVSTNVPVGNPTAIVAFATPGVTFSSIFASASTVNLTFQENFATALLPRILTSGGPFSYSRQDVPGEVYSSESQFTPCFSNSNCSSAPESSIGFANTGTELLAQLTGLGGQAASLSVPNQISDAIGTEAYLIVGGQPVMSTGSTSLPVANGTVEVLYEVAAGNASAIDTLTIPATLLNVSGAPLAFPAQAVFAGQLAPVNNTGAASATAPEPRFVSGVPAHK
jgi:hypothetical protein